MNPSDNATQFSCALIRANEGIRAWARVCNRFFGSKNPVNTRKVGF